MDDEVSEKVVVTDVDIPFWSLAGLLFKFVLAIIPVAVAVALAALGFGGLWALGLLGKLAGG